MNVKTIVVGAFEVNCYIVWDSKKSAYIIDPGGDWKKIADFIARNNLRLEKCLLTHGHCDHVLDAAPIAEHFGVPIAIHKNDLSWAFSSENQIPPYYGKPERPEKIDILDESSDPIFSIKWVHTPGHTPGSVCYYFEEHKLLFSGDTLFRGSVGRTDLPGGNSRLLAKSLKSLSKLPDDTNVFPGHGPQTTIGIEKTNNYFMKSNDL